MGEPHNSSRPSLPSKAISNIPVKFQGQRVGFAELKDGILTIDLMDGLTSQYIKEGLTIGLVGGLSLDTDNIRAFPAPNQIRMEI